MRILESAMLLVVGAALLTFAGISFWLFPRPLAAENPTILVEAMAFAGALFAGLGGRGLYRVNRAFRSNQRPTASQTTAA